MSSRAGRKAPAKKCTSCGYGSAATGAAVVARLPRRALAAMEQLVPRRRRARPVAVAEPPAPRVPHSGPQQRVRPQSVRDGRYMGRP